MNAKSCPKCKKEIPADSSFCNHCGFMICETENLTESANIDEKLIIASDFSQIEKNQSQEPDNNKMNCYNNKKKRGIMVTIFVLVLICASLSFALPKINDTKHYYAALKAATEGNFSFSIECFGQIERFSEKRVSEYYELLVGEMCMKHEYELALDLDTIFPEEALKLLPTNIIKQNETDISSQMVQYQYDSALQMISDGKYVEAYSALIELGDFEDSIILCDNLILKDKEGFYNLAISHLNDGIPWTVSKDIFTKLGDYSQCRAYLNLLEFVEPMQGTFQNGDGDRIIVNGSNVIEFTNFGSTSNYKFHKSTCECQRITVNNISYLQDINIDTKNDLAKYFRYDKNTDTIDFTYATTKGTRVSVSDLESISPPYRFKRYSNESVFYTELTLGMTSDEILNSVWGLPKEKNTTTTAFGTKEQWVYDGFRYLYLENGVLTAIQE